MILKVGLATQLQLELSWILSTIYWCDVYRKLIDIKSVYVGTTNTLAHTSYTECCRLQCRAVHHRHCRYRGGKQLIHTPALCVCHCQASDPPYPVPRLAVSPAQVYVVYSIAPVALHWSKQKIGNTLSFGCIWCSLYLSQFVLKHHSYN